MSSYHKNYHSGEHTGICVVRRKGEDVEDLLKRFRKKYSKSGISKELRDRMYHEKPSNKKRRKKQQSIRLQKREAEKLEKMAIRLQKIKQKKARKKKGVKYDSSSDRQNISRVHESSEK